MAHGQPVGEDQAVPGAGPRSPLSDSAEAGGRGGVQQVLGALRPAKRSASQGRPSELVAAVAAMWPGM